MAYLWYILRMFKHAENLHMSYTAVLELPGMPVTGSPSILKGYQ